MKVGRQALLIETFFELPECQWCMKNIDGDMDHFPGPKPCLSILRFCFILQLIFRFGLFKFGECVEVGDVDVSTKLAGERSSTECCGAF